MLRFWVDGDLEGDTVHPAPKGWAGGMASPGHKAGRNLGIIPDVTQPSSQSPARATSSETQGQDPVQGNRAASCPGGEAPGHRGACTAALTLRYLLTSFLCPLPLGSARGRK